jgi:hypothetical protein
MMLQILLLLLLYIILKEFENRFVVEKEKIINEMKEEHKKEIKKIQNDLNHVYVFFVCNYIYQFKRYGVSLIANCNKIKDYVEKVLNDKKYHYQSSNNTLTNNISTNHNFPSANYNNPNSLPYPYQHFSPNPSPLSIPTTIMDINPSYPSVESVDVEDLMKVLFNYYLSVKF